MKHAGIKSFFLLEFSYSTLHDFWILNTDPVSSLNWLKSISNSESKKCAKWLKEQLKKENIISNLIVKTVKECRGQEFPALVTISNDSRYTVCSCVFVEKGGCHQLFSIFSVVIFYHYIFIWGHEFTRCPWSSQTIIWFGYECFCHVT